MRTAILILVGLIIAGIIIWRTPPSKRLLAIVLFDLFWLVVCGWNLRTGLSHGYTLEQELPIHIVLYAVPVAIATIVTFILSRRNRT